MQVRLSREREFTLDRCFRPASCRAEKTRIPNQCVDGVALPAAVVSAVQAHPDELAYTNFFGGGTAQEDEDCARAGAAKLE